MQDRSREPRASNETERRTRPANRVHLLILVPLLLALAACGQAPGITPPEDEVTVVNGVVSLPPGSGIDLASLSVTTALGSFPVSAAGEFTADVLGGAGSEIGVETAAGELLLLGVSSGANADLSLLSTAEALLYYAVGGMWLPADKQDRVRELLQDAGEAELIAVELERLLLGGSLPLDAVDDQLQAALDEAHASVLGTAGAGAARLLTSSFEVVPSADEGNNIIVEPTTMQAGAMVLHNPAGAGVVAQNHMRRPAAMLAYEVAWFDDNGVETTVDPPVLVETVDVPATGQLEFLNAIADVFTGDSPWSPVLSEKLSLPGHEGASRTRFELILLGPSTSGVDWPIMADERFLGFHDVWDEVVVDKSIELFLNELLLPLVEVYGLGGMAKLDAGKLKAMRERVRIIHDKHMAELGVFLTQGQVGYANGLRFLMQELIENRTYRLDMLDMVRDALEESDKNKASIEAMERRLAGRASASAIAAAVQTVLVGGDVAKIMYDLVSVPAAVDWTAVSAPALFALTPDQAVVTQGSSVVKLTVVPRGDTPGNYLYRWTTSGNHGSLSDLLEDGDTIVTDSAEIWYFHDDPTRIEDTDTDTVTVEVFEVDEGTTSVPPGAQALARMVATIEGDDRLIDSRIEVNYGATAQNYGCAEMYLRFPADEDAKSYTVRIRGVGGQGAHGNTNQDFRYYGPNHDLFIDPDAERGPTYVEDGYTADWNGVCTWLVDGHVALQPATVAAWYDREEEDYLVHLFTVVQHGLGSDPLTIAGTVPLWYDWVADATFEVEPAY